MIADKELCRVCETNQADLGIPFSVCDSCLKIISKYLRLKMDSELVFNRMKRRTED